MNKLIIVFCAFAFSGCVQVERDAPGYLYTINLEKIENNRLFVELMFTGS